ncbi:hypothetical protein Glove_319g124 [Diversispora epigaea]|uniref:CHCH domain-containing protein n=1 Tax=Diversispora epigaea TaxID=1348612 RepID=A0A397HU61_9GLOM|nr:hypothetical protein Glove_319g123 [Diversispora epigaea]RHZ65106.1 hypothetical protein Glove_319g124 [Diversispora epigaea]
MTDMTDIPSATLPTHKVYKYKQNSQFLDPCQEQTLASMKCLEENNFAKHKCQAYFLNFKECKKKWTVERREMRKKGLL